MGRGGRIVAPQFLFSTILSKFVPYSADSHAEHRNTFRTLGRVFAGRGRPIRLRQRRGSAPRGARANDGILKINDNANYQRGIRNPVRVTLLRHAFV